MLVMSTEKEFIYLFCPGTLLKNDKLESFSNFKKELFS